MKKKIGIRVLSAVVILSLICTYISCPAYAKKELPRTGQTVEGFTVSSVGRYEAVNSDYVALVHEKTGAKVVYFANDDINRAFDISFRTPLENNKGTAHILEHSVLSGSENYPSSTLYMKASNQTYNTYMNAFTYQNFTTYPVSSLSEEQLYKLSDYYLDCVFNPNIYLDDSAFDREGWHYELHSADDELTVSGTVYSEIQGVDTISNSAYYNMYKTMFPDSSMSYIAGGVMSDVTELTNEEVVEYHSKYYHPSNSLTVLYGDIDYEKFLDLLDSYFSEYEEKDIQIDLKSYTPTENYIEKTYEYPAYSGENIKSYITYSIECKGAYGNDIAVLGDIVDIMNDKSSILRSWASSAMIGVGVGCYLETDGPEPLLVFYAYNADENDKEKFKDLVDMAVFKLAQSGIGESSAVAEIIAAKKKRAEAVGVSGENIGIALSEELATVWAVSGECDIKEKTSESDRVPFDNEQIIEVAQKYLVSGRKAFVINVPKAGLKEQMQTETEAKLAEIKAAMSVEEINSIVEATKRYNESTANVQMDEQLLEKLSAVDAQSLPEEYRTYDITDVQNGDIRYVNVKTNVDDIGKGRIMIDVSHISGEDLYWLALYNALIGNVDTEKYGMNELNDNINRYFDGGTDIVTLKTENGFTPYLILKYEGFADDSEQIFDIAEQILFKTNFSDAPRFENFISQMIASVQSSIDDYGDSYMAYRAKASSDLEYAYLNETFGTGFYNFLNETADMIYEEPQEFTDSLERIKTLLYNRNGGCILYAGTPQSIEKNNAAAEKFFANVPYSEKTQADFSELKTEFTDTAMIISSDVSSSGMYAPFDVLGSEYSGKYDVILGFVRDKWLIPELRNKNNAYGVEGSCDEYGLAIYSYRDPEVKSTFEVYSELAETIANSQITQDEIDNYILPVYAEFIMPDSELHEAYWVASDYMNGIEQTEQVEKMKAIKSTAVEDVKNSAKVFEKLWSDGMKFTAGNEQTIAENEDLYDVILNPFNYKSGDEINILINGEQLRTDVPPRIVSYRTVVPMRGIFEELGAEVEWNGDTREVTAVKDGKKIVITINSKKIVVTEADGSVSEIETDVAAMIENDRTLIPLRVVSETLGYEVEWDAYSSTVYITD